MPLLTLVREKVRPYARHDQLFKELIHAFFEEFLEVFFPEAYRHLDFSSIKPLSEEVYTDLFEGKTRRMDIIVEATLKGQDTLIIIHVEPQSYYEKNFHERMYHYFSMLYNKYRKPILPIAVFSYDEKHHEQNHYTMEFPFLRVLTFNFYKLELRKKNWREYIESNNPVAAALLSKMDYTEEERVQVRIEFLRMMTRMKLDPARARLIYGFFERYLKLNKQEEEQLMEKIKQTEEAEEILHLPISWEERGIEKGKLEEKRNNAVEMLKKGLSDALIIEVTKLNKEELEALKKKLD